jgi:hypothetical protein
MELEIHSRKLNRTFTFWAPMTGGYIYLTTEEKPGTMGRQICHGGGFSGSTLSASTEAGFKAQCRAWYRAYMRGNPE